MENDNLLRIGHLMKVEKISREEMAKQLGVTTATVTNLTSGKTFPSKDVLLKCCEILDVDIRDLFNSSKELNDEGKLKEGKRLIKEGMSLIDSIKL
jgi:transcriptional regulator with XRE-family HTH domain